MPSHVSLIRRINARFRRLKNKNGPVTQRLIGDKERLIDAMIAACSHPKVLATRGARAFGMMRLPFRPRRICVWCGCCENPRPRYRLLAGRPAETLPVADYLVAEGKVLKRLGINI